MKKENKTDLDKLKTDSTVSFEDTSKFKVFFENAAVAIVAVDKSGKIILVNKLAEIMFLYKREELIGEYIEILIPAKKRKNHIKHRNDYINKPQNRAMGIGLTLSGVKKDGSEFPVEVALNHIELNESKISVAYINDISQRKIEDELWQSKELLRSVLDQIPQRVFWKDTNFNYLGCNTQFAKDAGFESSDEIKGKNDFELLWKDEAPYYRKEDEYILNKNGEILNFQNLVTNKSGTIWLNTNKIPLKNKDGEIIGIIGSSENITAIKEAVEKSKRLTEKLSVAVKSGNIGIWDFDLEKNALFWDDQMYELYGICIRDFNGTLESWLNYLHPDDKERVSEQIKVAIENKNEQFDSEFRIIWPDNETKHLKSLAMVQRSEENIPLRMIGVNYDITDKRKAKETLEIYASELERSNKELQDFIYIASHDLQEPLRKVQGFGERLKKKFSETLGETGIDYIERMQNASSRMQVLIEDLLTYSRVTTKAKPFFNTDLNKVLDGVLNDLEIVIEKEKVIIEFDKLPIIEADEIQMRQLFQNLISNAIKFHKENETPVIKISSTIFDNTIMLMGEKEKVKYCKIIIEDNGIGIEKEYSKRIFEVFERLHGRDQYVGTGIGLAIVKKIIERHHGSICANSENVDGTQFIIDLPVKQIERRVKND